ncbi:unnamed protein product [Peronospora belbahrii]|uniref:Uncharacterized protein n=1 Tax=Peronospora belbahrii TaxID=622444 RepID=A0AAU9L9V6_9STRA|nr:unnamed protein product [Peronospora belbahrii]CAH0516920.1 unnamed protein product [Peronospora belbahrii]
MNRSTGNDIFALLHYTIDLRNILNGSARLSTHSNHTYPASGQIYDDQNQDLIGCLFEEEGNKRCFNFQQHLSD